MEMFLPWKAFALGTPVAKKKKMPKKKIQECSSYTLSFICWPLGSVLLLVFLGFLCRLSVLSFHFDWTFLISAIRHSLFPRVGGCQVAGKKKKHIDTGLPILIKLKFILLQYLSPPGHREQAISFNSLENMVIRKGSKNPKTMRVNGVKYKPEGKILSEKPFWETSI